MQWKGAFHLINEGTYVIQNTGLILSYGALKNSCVSESETVSPLQVTLMQELA